MPPLRLVIGNKNYSSWSLRPWLALRAAGVPFEEVRIPLYTEASRAEIRRWTPAGRVPVLHHDGLVIWDSLAICEYVAELAPEAGLWPSDRRARAAARAVCAEMHAGFAALREELPMNLRLRARREPSPAARHDAHRVQELWNECRARYGRDGEFLFGRFGLADCFYAPVATRFRSWGLPLDPVSARWAEAVLAHPAFLEWEAEAVQEKERIAAAEPA